MIMQKPDVVGLLCGSLLEVSRSCLNDLKEAGESLPVGVAVERAEAVCSGSSICCPPWPLPLRVGCRAAGWIPPFSGTLPFSQVSSQAVQEVGGTPGLLSWVTVVQMTKGQRQRGSEHCIFQAPDHIFPNFNSDHVPLKSSQVTSPLLPLSILQVSFLPPGTHPLA